MHAKEFLLLMGVILGVGTLTGFIARLLKVPDVVMFLLAGIALVGMKVPYSDVIASVTFMAILITILLQATTTEWLARKLDLLKE